MVVQIEHCHRRVFLHLISKIDKTICQRKVEDKLLINRTRYWHLRDYLCYCIKFHLVLLSPRNQRGQLQVEDFGDSFKDVNGDGPFAVLYVGEVAPGDGGFVGQVTLGHAAGGAQLADYGAYVSVQFHSGLVLCKDRRFCGL